MKSCKRLKDVILGRLDHKCKGPEAGICLMYEEVTCGQKGMGYREHPSEEKIHWVGPDQIVL